MEEEKKLDRGKQEYVESEPCEPENKGYEYVNHPSHYNRYSIEAVEMARRIWGDEALITAAEITAFFYRMRLGLKPDVPVFQDIEKEEFWLNYARNLKAKVTGNEGDDRQVLKD